MRRNALLAAGLAIAQSAFLASPVAASPTGPGVSDTIFANGFENFVLAIDNYLAWCTVSVNGGPFSANPAPTVYAPGTVVPLSGQPASPTFIWGYWRFTDVAGHDVNQVTQVTMTSDRTVFVCCPFSNGTGCPAD